MNLKCSILVLPWRIENIVTWILFLKLILSASVGFGQMPVQEIPKLNTAIEFDGKVSEEEWGAIDTLELVSHWPTYSEKPNKRTWLRVAYDDKYFLISAVCFGDPADVQEPTFERDAISMRTDQITILLDAYNDNENALCFVVTPTGSRSDLSVFNDAQGQFPADVSWNSFWEAKVSKTDYAWTMEARIPFSSLRFQSINNIVTMGLIAYRYIPKNRELDIFPKVKPDWGFWSFFKPSQAQDVSFSNLQNKRPWFTSPYILGRTGYHHISQDEGNYPDKINDNTVTAGLDVQHALTDNMNLDLTVNTDFAQVEADDQIVNLSRFSFFFPEKRRFFLERSSIMEFGFEANNRLFYSRRIGIDDGRIVPLWGGARIVGRINNYDVGFLNMQSREIDGNPSENFGVFRLRKRVSKNNSYIGGIFTSRTDWKGTNNFAYGVDGIINLFKNDYLKINLAGSYNSLDTITYSNSLSDRKRIYVMWENRSQVGFNYSLSYSQVDKNYSPGLGFELRSNFKAVGDRLSYGWFPKNGKAIRYIRFDLLGTAYFTSTTNELESFFTSPTFYLEWKKYSSLTVAYNRFYDHVPEPFDLSSTIQIPAKEYTNKDITVNYQTPTVSFLNANFLITTGTFYDGKRFSGGITPNYTISKYLTLSGFYQYNQILFDNNVTYKAHVARLKISASLNIHLSVNAFVQINSLTNVSAVNFRLRYNWKDGDDLYIVYNETLNNDGKTDVTKPFSDYRAIIVKYIHTFHLGR